MTKLQKLAVAVVAAGLFVAAPAGATETDIAETVVSTANQGATATVGNPIIVRNAIGPFSGRTFK